MTSFAPEHARRLRFVRDAGFVGDGGRVYYTVAAIDDDLRERHGLWLHDLDGAADLDRAADRRVAPELGDVRSPAPAPDGALIALLADVDGHRQIMLVPVDGGPHRQLTALPQGVTGRPVWSPDGRSIAFAAGPERPRDPALPYRVDRVTYRSDGLGYLDDAVTDLYVVEVGTGAVRRLTADRCLNADPRWSPDGRSLCYLVGFPPDREWNWLPEAHVLDVATGASSVVVDAAWGGALAAEWCPDGTRIAFVGARVGTTLISAQQEIDVWTVDLADRTPRCRGAAVRAGLGRPLLSHDLPIAADLGAPRLRVAGGAAYVSGQEGGRVAVYRVALDGPPAVARVDTAPGSAYLVDFHPARGVLHQAMTFVEPPDLMLGDRRVTALNDDLLAGVARPEVRPLRITAPDGLSSDAWALTPAGAGPWPTLLYVHGGPFAGAVGSAYFIDFQLLTGAGFAVVFGNFRGSMGYDAGFAARMAGDWGRNGALDHHATVDEAIRVGIADPDRLGVFGLSHGGFATCWLVGTSDRFRAAVAENPATSFATWYGTMDTAWWFRGEHGGTPDEVPEVYRDRSPLTYAASCATPVLFIVGELDMCCHPIESEQYYRVLKANGVRTAMLRLPGSAHGGTIGGPVPARIAQNEALLDWFTEHLDPSAVTSEP